MKTLALFSIASLVTLLSVNSFAASKSPHKAFDASNEAIESAWGENQAIECRVKEGRAVSTMRGAFNPDAIFKRSNEFFDKHKRDVESADERAEVWGIPMSFTHNDPNVNMPAIEVNLVDREYQPSLSLPAYKVTFYDSSFMDVEMTLSKVQPSFEFTAYGLRMGCRLIIAKK
jgi:hypothetical protein